MRKLFQRLFLWIVMLLAIGCSSTAPETSVDTVPEVHVEEKAEPEVEEKEVLDEKLEEVQEEIASMYKQFPNPEQAELIIRIQEGIPGWQKKVHHGWWECGVEVTPEKEEESALRWAFRIVQLAHEYSDDDFTMNPWGLAGLVANESGFDRCAVGPFLREWGYKKGDMKKKRGGAISHSIDEIEKFLFQPKVLATVKKGGFDVGPMQELWRCREDRKCRSIFWDMQTPWVDFEKLFTMDSHFDSGVRELRRRARVNKTDRPWACWRTGRYADWYDKKITRWAKMIGAKDGEI